MVNSIRTAIIYILISVACSVGDYNIRTSGVRDSEVIIKNHELEPISIDGIDVSKSSSVSDLNSDRLYKSIFDLPFDNMIFAEKKVFEKLKEQYGKIEFLSVFEIGDIEKYDYYIENFHNLLNDNERFFQKDIGESFLFSEYYLRQTGSFDLNNYVYIFFDIDNDKEPELGVIDAGNDINIFKYISSKNEFVLWKELTPSYYRLSGTLRARYNREDSTHIFFSMEPNGEMKEIVSFFIRPEFVDEIYIVSIPKNIDISLYEMQELKKEAYYIEEDNTYYFRVTKEEYEILTKEYFEAESIAENGIKEVSFSYDELFKTLEQ